MYILLNISIIGICTLNKNPSVLFDGLTSVLSDNSLSPSCNGIVIVIFNCSFVGKVQFINGSTMIYGELVANAPVSVQYCLKAK